MAIIEKIIILAGGLGTRMRSTLGNTPKPLAPIGGAPFLEYLLRYIAGQDIFNVIISAGHEFQAIKNIFGDGSLLSTKIEYTFEKNLLGTAGVIKLAEHLIDTDNFLVVNGDTFLEVNYSMILRFHRAKRALATLALVEKKDASRYGSVILGPDNRILEFEEKHEDKKSNYINGGLYVFNKRIFNYIADNTVCSLERDILPSLMSQGLYGFPVKGYFIDIGIPKDYEKAKRELPLRKNE
jgi:D-glycero-alpha-D-manno-heptose 1-phosphate guanylyltransferase